MRYSNSVLKFWMDRIYYICISFFMSIPLTKSSLVERYIWAFIVGRIIIIQRTTTVWTEKCSYIHKSNRSRIRIKYEELFLNWIGMCCVILSDSIYCFRRLHPWRASVAVLCSSLFVCPSSPFPRMINCRSRHPHPPLYPTSHPPTP